MEIIKIKTDSLAQLSYLLIDGSEGVVIDPRRDAEIYFNLAQEKGAKIKYIFETHRNEDFITGSRELKRHCSAQIYHGKGLNFEFGNFVEEGQQFTLENIKLSVLETPGHTPESISLALYPDKECEDAVAVFTGDTLFVNDVGRTDFFPDQLEEYAAMLFESIHNKILPLGDQVALYPAHGAGSVCGGGIADRELSTLGYEKKHNPMLQLSKKEFIERKLGETHLMPPYFKKMEEVNLKGSDEALKNYESLELFSVRRLKSEFSSLQVVDIRSPEAFLGCHVPQAISIPKDMLAAYGGYFLNYKDPILFIADSLADARDAKKELKNLGYDKVRGFLKGGVSSWETSGEKLANLGLIEVSQISKAIEDSSVTLLDVRKPDEWEKGVIANARTIFLGNLLNNLEELDPKEPIITYCGSGKRATIAASLLQANGYSNLKVFMGSMKAYVAKEKK